MGSHRDPPNKRAGESSRPSKALTGHCEGTVQSLNPETLELTFAGKGRATVLGLYVVEGNSTAFPRSPTNGLIRGGDTSTTKDGSTIKSEFAGVYEVLDSGKIKFRVTARWGEGTGRLTGVTGEAEVVAVLDGLAPGSAFFYDTIGTLKFSHH